eukprot:1258724-Rhodomonas_salina.1
MALLTCASAQTHTHRHHTTEIKHKRADATDLRASVDSKSAELDVPDSLVRRCVNAERRMASGRKGHRIAGVRLRREEERAGSKGRLKRVGDAVSQGREGKVRRRDESRRKMPRGQRMGLGGQRMGLGGQRMGLGGQRMGLGGQRMGLGGQRMGLGGQRMGVHSNVRLDARPCSIHVVP